MREREENTERIIKLGMGRLCVFVWEGGEKSVEEIIVKQTFIKFKHQVHRVRFV